MPVSPQSLRDWVVFAQAGKTPVLPPSSDLMPGRARVPRILRDAIAQWRIYRGVPFADTSCTSQSRMALMRGASAMCSRQTNQ
jgi:hypothetical protein